MFDTAIQSSIQDAKDLILKRFERTLDSKNGATLEILLLHMPREWRGECKTFQPYSRSMAETVFAAATELIAEGKLKLVPYFVSEGVGVTIMQDGSSESEQNGHWEFGVMPTTP